MGGSCEKSKRTNPFAVYEMTESDFMSFKSLEDLWTKKSTTDDKRLLQFSKICCFKFDIAKPRQMLIKYSINEEFHLVSIGKRGISTTPKMENILQKKYPEPIKINVKKLKDIKTLLQYIPQINQGFYNNLNGFLDQNDVDIEDSEAEIIE